MTGLLDNASYATAAQAVAEAIAAARRAGDGRGLASWPNAGEAPGLVGWRRGGGDRDPGLTKDYGSVLALGDLSDIEPGITGL
jgi:hypothetical protein